MGMARLYGWRGRDVNGYVVTIYPRFFRTSFRYIAGIAARIDHPCLSSTSFLKSRQYVLATRESQKKTIIQLAEPGSKVRAKC